MNRQPCGSFICHPVTAFPTMMLSACIAGLTILDIAREGVPYLLYMIVLLYVLIFFRGLVLWVPNTLFH
jgi:TRAP-type C4-dicarboxylate transport system permease large subunit